MTYHSVCSCLHNIIMMIIVILDSLPRAGATAYHTENYVYGRLTGFNCNGSETNLTDCQFTDLRYNYGENAGIKCCE